MATHGRTMDRPENRPLEELLLEHTAWVQALARRMVGDGAEDLVQETWVAALAQRPEVRSPRGWLAGVLAHLARGARRGDARRRLRETRRARESSADAGPSVAETVEAAATGRELADLVLALEEPFRAVVLLRYYEDLPPRRIAERLGIPVRTVNSRLARGLERLRERWRLRQSPDERDGGRRSLLALAGLRAVPAGAAAAVVPIGVLLMNAKVVLAVALVAGGALVWWLGGREGVEHAGALEPVRDVQASAVLDEAAAPQVALATAEPAGERRSVPAAPSAVEQPPAAATTRTLRGRVLDPEALPLVGVEIAYREYGDAPPVVARSGANGLFELEVRRESGGQVSAVDPALVTVMRGQVDSRSEVEPLIVVAPRLDLAGSVRDELGSPLARVHVSFENPPGFSARFAARFDSTDTGQWDTSSDEAGSFELAAVPHIEGASLVASLEGFETWRGALPWTSDRALVVTLARTQPGLSFVAGRCVDSEGRPVAGAWVSLGAGSTASDAAGEFRLARTGALDSFELKALKGGVGLGRATAGRDEHDEPLWPGYVVLELGGAPLALAGRVVDADGKPRPGLRLWLDDPTPFGILRDEMMASVEHYFSNTLQGRYDDDGYASFCETDGDGRFRLEGLLERGYSLRVMDRKTLEIATFGPYVPGGAEVEVRFARGALGRITGRVVGRDGSALPGMSIAVMARTYGGVWMSGGSMVTGSDGRFAFEDVGGEELTLSVSGDDVLPGWYPVAAPHGQEVALELTVPRRCHLKVDLGSRVARADALRVLDAQGAALTLFRIGATGSYRNEEFPLVEGRSDTLGVDERASTLVLLKDGIEVERVPLALRPLELNVITP